MGRGGLVVVWIDEYDEIPNAYVDAHAYQP